MRQARLAELVRFARTSSPYYRALYRDLPDNVDAVDMLPITSKKQLMARFDEWVTDPAITLAKVQAFIDDPKRIGEPFLGKYHIAVTSGTTGSHGVFLMNPDETAASAKINRNAKLAWIGVGGLLKLLRRGLRLAAITSTGEHFGFFAGIIYMQKSSRFLRDRMRVFSVHMPVSELVEQLNAFQPTLIMGYASMVALLAGEQERGRMHISPVFIEVMSEKLVDSEFQRVGRVFKTRPYQMYGSTECPFASSICEYGWYHINSDAVILEPVDKAYQPVAPGTLSHTILVTNLINKTQPILRYDIGDSVVVRPDPCPCGDPHPAIQVQGRAADVLKFETPGGDEVMVPPLLFVTLIDRMRGIDLFQVVQTSPSALKIRLHYATDLDESQQDARWQILYKELKTMLAGRALEHLSIERDFDPPQQSQGGKFRMVIPLAY